MTTWDRIQQLMEIDGIGKKGLADLCGVQPSAVTKWSRGGKIGAEYLSKIAARFDIDVDYILGHDPRNLREIRADQRAESKPTVSPEAAARYNAEMAIRAAGKLPESARALNWLCSALLMVGSGLENGGSPAMEKEAVRVLGLLFRHARGDEEPAKKG